MSLATLLRLLSFRLAGEASIITLSAPFIDDVAPEGSVSLWFAILSSAPPIGVALGELPFNQPCCWAAASALNGRAREGMQLSLGLQHSLIQQLTMLVSELWSFSDL